MCIYIWISISVYVHVCRTSLANYNSIQYHHSYRAAVLSVLSVYFDIFSLYLRVGIVSSIYDWSQAPVRVSFQEVASAILWESCAVQGKERVLRLLVGLFGKFKEPPAVLTNFPLLLGDHKKWFRRAKENARATASANVIKIYYRHKENRTEGTTHRSKLWKSRVLYGYRSDFHVNTAC